MEINLLDDVAPASNELGAIAEAAQRVLILQDEINALREQLKDKEQTLRQLTETEMPDLMQELNVKDFTLTDGSKVSLTDIVSVSIPQLVQLTELLAIKRRNSTNDNKSVLIGYANMVVLILSSRMWRFLLAKVKMTAQRILKKICVKTKSSTENLLVCIIKLQKHS